MTDYGHDLTFGTFLTPVAAGASEVVELARLTDQVGLDLVTVQDHPYQPSFLDTWTLLSVIAAQTSSARVVPNVANLALRPPAVLARSAASLDILSGGRVELGLGTGAFWDGIVAMGGTALSPGELVDALEEAIAVIRGLWDTNQRSVRVDGDHHRVVGARTGPAPVHPIGLWIGAYKQRMLELTGRLADGWVPSLGYADPEALNAMNARIDDAAQQAGRSPADIRRLYNINGSFTGDRSGGAQGFLQGPPQAWVEQLAELTLTEGISGYILGTDSADDIRRFAAEVVPAVVELVTAERKGDGSEERGQQRPPSEPALTSAPAPSTSTSTFTVHPTPDDGVRYSTERFWDESTRPSVPTPDTQRTYTQHELSAGQHLVDIHDQLRQELSQVRDLVEQVAAGSTSAGAARSQINAMTMRQNNWTLGTYCESYCRAVTTHHTIEDQSVFPHLQRNEPALTPVLDRLRDEHLVIHDVLERVDRALVSLVSEEPGSADSTGVTGGLAQVRAAVDVLTDTMLSHLSYEERELVEPLARHGYY
ncbi:MAG TPA: LLM class flavin-dependent oxidoreductase [Jiangellaceae bacterium]|nr:LLM class flavin-dependent oxidoreductase [Jiangellaceae bacterium]